MKKKFTFLIAALLLLTMISQPTRLWGQTKAALFSETFNSCNGTGGNDGNWNGNIASSDLNTDETWSKTDSGKGANKCAKFGTGSKLGKAQTSSISYTGDLSLTFKAAAWDGNSESTNLKLSVTQGTLKQNGNTITSVTLVKGSWTTYTVDIVGVTSATQITFEGNSSSNSRFFLDDVVVTPKHSITYAVSPAGSGSVSGVLYNTSTVVASEAFVTEGGKVTLTAAPANAAYTFSSWSVSGTGSSVANSTANPTTFTMGTANATVTAYFVSAGPTVTIDPTSYNFGEVTVGTTPSPTHTFSVTPANLTADLTITVPSGYSVSPSSISQSTTTATNVTVTFTPTDVQAYNGNLSISGGGLGSAVTASLSGTGGCITPSALTYTSPVNLTLENGEAEYQLTPTGGGNGGSISYAVTTNPGGNGDIIGDDEDTFYAIETGQYVVTATQAANGNYCECVATITINVTGTDPVCEITPSTGHNFGTILTNTSESFDFSVAIANLEHGLTLSVPSGYEVSPASIAANASSPVNVTVTFTPTAATAYNGSLTISGDDFDNDITAALSGTGDAGYTVTFNPYSGSCTPTSIRVLTGGSIATLPTATADGATFYGWATSKVASTPTAPTSSIVSAPYTPTGNVTLHAVYKIAKEFDNTAACAGSYKIYATVSSTDYYATGSISSGKYSSTTTASNGKSFTLVKETGYGNDEWAIKDGNNYVYYNTGTSLGTTGSIADNCKWKITQGVKGTWRATSATTTTRAILFSNDNSTNKFAAYATSNIVNPNQGNYYDIEFGSASFTYNSEAPVAKPTFNIAGGSYAGEQSITISCATLGATIYYTTNGSDPTASSTEYTGAITVDETMTIKAIAIKSGMSNSTVAYATYSIVPLLTTMDEIFAAATANGETAGDVAVTFNNWLVSGKSGDYVAYVTDNNGKGFKIYKYGHGFKVNDKLSGTVTGTPLKLDNGASQFTNLATSSEGLTVTEDGGTITPVAKTISELSGVNTGAVVTISNLTYNGTNLVDGSENTITPNTSLFSYGSALTSGHDYTSVTGVFVMNNTTKQIHPRSAADIVEVEYKITLNDVPSGCTIGTSGDITTAKYGQTVTLTQSAGAGYRFISWSVNSGAVTVTNNQFTMPKGNVTVSATFAQTYNIAYNVTPANTGTVTAEPNPAIEGETVTLTIEPEDGYALKSITAYKTDDTETLVTITENTIIMPAYGVTVAAEFATEHSVTYNVNGGDGDAVVVKYGAGATVNAADVPGAWTAPTGKLFVNWKTVESGEGDEYEVGDQITDNIDDDIVLYAQWRDIVYHVSFSVNGVIDHDNDIDVAYNTAIGSLPEDPELAPLTFLGWSSTSPTGATNVTASWKPTGENEDVTVYAVFGSMGTGDLTLEVWNDMSTSYPNSEATWSGNQFKYYNVTKGQYSQNTYIQFKSAGGYIYNSADFGAIKSVTVNYYNSDDHNIAIKVGDAALTTEDSGSDEDVTKGTEADNSVPFTISGNHHYLRIYNTSATNKVNSIEINYEAAAPLTVNIIDEDTDMSTDIAATTCVVVKDGATLNFTGKNNGNANNLIIEDGGKLITKSSGVQATVKKNVTAANNWGEGEYAADGWYFIASPVNGASYSTAITTGSGEDYDLFMLDWENKQWLNKKVAANSEAFGAGFTRGTGYLYASKAGNTLSVAGEIQPLTEDDTVKVILKTTGWNLIGNPLTCKVTVDHEFGLLNNGSSVDYNGTTVNPFQGIVVYGATNEEVTFTKAASQDAAAPSNTPSIQMTLAQNIVTRGNTTANTVDNAVVSFNEGSKLPKFNMLAGNANLYIPQDNEEYAIVSSSAQGEMPVNFRAYEAGEYTITVNPEEVEMGYLHLIDNIAGKDVDLIATPSYTFNARTDDYESRFRLVFSANMVNAELGDDFAFISNGQIIVNGTGTIQIIDIMGRVVSTRSTEERISTNGMTAGVYVLRLIGNDTKTQKIVIR